ncbi:tetratricopeptide repeat protein [Luteimonas panaciterrae]|uniref:tetratricopeptide repeat protein n=1 Tax=Luteimonas panaciterrae TaxID=363885 RepID=UPI001CFB530C|nr:tetratricopeptide repeat protein [Luteimonas panaciterrae]
MRFPRIFFPLPLLLSAVVLAPPALALDRPAGETKASRSAKTPAADTLTATLAGEYALQAGRLEEAVDWYLQAARSADGDAGLAERATRIGLLAKDNARSEQALALWRQRAPASLGMRKAEAILALRNDDVRTARKLLEAMMRDSDPDGWREAVRAIGSGTRNPTVAADLLRQLVDAGAVPNELQAWLTVGGLAQQLGEPALAERVVKDVIKRFPNEPRVGLLHANQLRQAGKPEEARQALAAIDERALLMPELRMLVASEYNNLDDPKTAADVLANGPQTEDTWGLRAVLLDKAKDKPALQALYDELNRDSASPDSERRLLLGQVAEFLERYDEALNWYGSIPGGQDRMRARLHSAKLLHDIKRKDQAFADLRAMQSDASIDDETRSNAYLLEAELRKEDQDDQGELDAYARGLAAYPDDSALLYSRALMWERRDDVPRAEADLRKILVAEPDNTSALNALGYTLADRTTRYAEALELIDRARVAEPDNGAIIDSHGWVLYRLGRKEEALVELRRAYTLSKDPEIAAHIAEVLWMSGKKDEARKYFDEARKLDPDNRALKRALEKTGA